VRDQTDSGQPGTHRVKVLGVRAELALSGKRDEKIAAIARLQRGRVARRQLRAAGLSYKVIAAAVRRGALIPLPGAVFAVGHFGASELAEETAALLACPEGAALSHRTAAKLWDMAPADGIVDIVVPEGAKTRADGFRIHRSRGLEPRDIRIRKGLPVTSPARTLLDEADDRTPRQLELEFDRAIVSRIMRTDDLAELLGRTRGRRGSAPLRALLERQHGTTRTRSGAEELFLDLVRQARLPPPQTNVKVAGYEVDFLWPEQNLIVEVDGYCFHSTHRVFHRDHRKDADLRTAGFHVIRVSFEQLERQPFAVIADVTRGLTDRRPATPSGTPEATPSGTQVATISVPSSGEMATSTE
jgi:very-short-patch-repair endonuclease